MDLGKILHVVDHSSCGRAQQARVAFGIGWHAEVYASIDELMTRPPRQGVLIVRDEEEGGEVRAALRALARSGTWLPVLGSSQNPRPSSVVSAIKEGAMDYIALPVTKERLEQSLRLVAEEARAFGEAWRRVAAARARVALLTPRERQVLDWLAQGCSNKSIARELGISPRTVEIHRANMMTKVKAENSADAIRLRIEAQLGVPQANGTPNHRGSTPPQLQFPPLRSEPVRELRRRLALQEDHRQRLNPKPSAG